MENFEAVVFDMDGLLIDSEKLALEAFKVTCSKYNLKDLTPVFMKCVGTNKMLCQSILQDALEGLMDYKRFIFEWDTVYFSLTSEPIPLMNGVIALLDHIQALKIPMIVATSSKTEKAKLKLNNTNILSYFEHIIGGDQVVHSKPDPEIYLKAASYLSVNSSACLAFEDSANGVRSAVAAGMTVIQIPDLVIPDEDLLNLGHIVLSRIDEAIDYDF